MSWATIRDGMKTRLDTISGLKAHDVLPSVMPDANVAVVLPGEPLLEPSGHAGMVDVNIRVVVRCSRATVQDAQNALDAYVWPSGTNSIQAAVEGGPQLGGAVDDCRFVRVAAYGTVEDAGTQTKTAGAMQADVMFRGKVHS